MMKRLSGPSREENYEHVLMCLICRSLFDDHDHQPKFLPCHHTFCKDCLREYVHQMGDEIECPSCRKIANVPAAGVSALQTNFYVKYIQSLVSGNSSGNARIKQCLRHSGEQLHFYCHDCENAICKRCTKEEGSSCSQHCKVPLTKATEQSHQCLDTSFAAANSAIEAKKMTVEAMLKGLAQEKDQALLKIDSTFEQHVHTLHRRGTLLKNKVIDIYNEHVSKLENDLEEVSTALTCIVSLKEYYEGKISECDFKDFDKGVGEMDEVRNNIVNHVWPAENHIVFEEKHGTEKFRGSAKDLGRVRNTRPPVPRSDQEGNYPGGTYDSSFTRDTSIKNGTATSSISSVSTPEDLQLTPTPGREFGGYSYSSHEEGTTGLTPTSLTVNESLTLEATIPKPCNSSKCELMATQQANELHTVSSRKDEVHNVLGTVVPMGQTSAVTHNQNLAVLDKSPATVRDAKSSESTPKVSKEPTPEPCFGEEPENSAACADGEHCNTPPLLLADVMTMSLDSKAFEKIMAIPDLMSASLDSKGFGGARPKTKTQRGSRFSDSKKSHKSRVISANANVCKSQENCIVSQPAGALAGPPVPDIVQQLKPHSFSATPVADADQSKLGTNDLKNVKGDKEYYHLLYTSYDEEELLQELRMGKGTIEDSDSWMTVSSADDSSSGTSTEEIIVVEKEQTSF